VLHRELIRAHGGVVGVRDKGLLLSALAAPEHTLLYSPEADIFDLAAAYCFHLVQNHPFHDGNKRIGLATALFFLDLNRVELDDPDRELQGATEEVAKGKRDKPALAKLLRRLSAQTIALTAPSDDS
jgi:death-on-curing protein